MPVMGKVSCSCQKDRIACHQRLGPAVEDSFAEQCPSPRGSVRLVYLVLRTILVAQSQILLVGLPPSPPCHHQHLGPAGPQHSRLGQTKGGKTY